jgi:hypothetical protein
MLLAEELDGQVISPRHQLRNAAWTTVKRIPARVGPPVIRIAHERAEALRRTGCSDTGSRASSGTTGEPLRRSGVPFSIVWVKRSSGFRTANALLPISHIKNGSTAMRCLPNALSLSLRPAKTRSWSTPLDTQVEAGRSTSQDPIRHLTIR